MSGYDWATLLMCIALTINLVNLIKIWRLQREIDAELLKAKALVDVLKAAETEFLAARMRARQ